MLLLITVGVLGFAAGWNAQATTGTQVFTLVEAAQPHVVLATSATRRQAETREQGCQVVPNGDVNQQKTKDQDSSIMKGLVF
jgi:hypothetical protein